MHQSNEEGIDCSVVDKNSNNSKLWSCLFTETLHQLTWISGQRERGGKIQELKVQLEYTAAAAAAGNPCLTEWGY